MSKPPLDPAARRVLTALALLLVALAFALYWTAVHWGWR